MIAGRMEQSVVVAMSGGVDSSVAAALLVREGWRVVGVTLQLKDCRDTPVSRSCCSIDAIARAKRVAAHLGIPHYTLDLQKEFHERILATAWREYAGGRTPSPCLLCNEIIKFGLLLEWTQQLGIGALATGHYARIVRSPEGRSCLMRGVDSTKDQSYFVSRLSSEQLDHVCFPLGAWTKQATRAFARDAGLPVAEQQESQDACLVGEGESFSEMLRRRCDGSVAGGPILDGRGVTLGQHEGIHHFTIGQHRNLGIGDGVKRWVKALDPANATVVVTEDEGALFSNVMTVTGICGNLKLGDPAESYLVQVRYRHTAAHATCRADSDGSVFVCFNTPQRALAPGQAAVFYVEDRVAASGWINCVGDSSVSSSKERM